MRLTSKIRREVCFLLLYTLLFAVAWRLAFHYFPEQGKRMIWRHDGLTQHYVALLYYSRWARAVLRSILAGRPSFPTYNLHIGFGSDLFTTFQYYVIGDPFSLPAVFVPEKYLPAFRDSMLALRMYLAGVCFDRFCCVKGHHRPVDNLCGALLYVFGSYTLFGMRHPYFLNALIFFPLLLIGAEKILRGGRGRMFTVLVFLSCISNFYFFYMLVLMTVFYVVWRTLRIHIIPCLSFPGGVKTGTGGRPGAGTGSGQKRRGQTDLRRAWKRVGRLAARFMACGLLGTGMGMCLFLPIVLRFLGDPRASEGSAGLMFYPADYYKGLVYCFMTYGQREAFIYWSCMGYGAVGVLCTLALFLRPGRKYRNLKTAWCCMLAMILLPAAGTIMNGFSYPANRWIWAFGLLMAYIAVVTVPEIPNLPWSRMAVLLVCLAVYAAACRAAGAPSSAFVEIGTAAAAVLLVRLIPAAVAAVCGRNRRGRLIRAALCSSILILAGLKSLSLHAANCFEIGVRSSGIINYASDNYVKAMIGSDAAGVRKIVDEAEPGEVFYRYSGRDLTNNYSVLHNVSNTQYFWSLSDASIVRFFTETGQGNASVDIYDSLDNRTMLDEIAGVKYYERSDGSLLPFGYHKLEGHKYDSAELFSGEEEEDLPFFRFAVHKNEYALPLGFTSDRAIAHSDWEKLSIPRRQEALMQGVVLEDGELSAADYGETCRVEELSFTEKSPAYTLETEEGTDVRRLEDGRTQIVVTDTDTPVRLVMEDRDDTAGVETSVLLTGVSYEELTGKDRERGVAALKEKLTAEAEKNGTAAPDHVGLERPVESVKVIVKAKRDGRSVSRKEVAVPMEYSMWGTGREDFLSCCGWSDTALDGISLTFSHCGVYTFQDLKVICQPMEDYPAQVEKFRSCVLEDLDLHELEECGATSRITGHVTIPGEEPGSGEVSSPERQGKRILCLQIPRRRGMQAFVDGKKASLLQADTMFSALVLEPGKHEIELRYRTPGLAAGVMISLLAWILFIAGIIVESRRKIGI